MPILIFFMCIMLIHRLSPSPFVFCVIYGYCMTFGETTSPDKSFVFSETISPILQIACGIMNSCKKSFQFKFNCSGYWWIQIQRLGASLAHTQYTMHFRLCGFLYEVIVDFKKLQMHKYTCITHYFINIIIREHNGSVLMAVWYTSIKIA